MSPISERGKYIPPINEKSRRSHRRQTVWQIFFPMLLGILIATLLFVLVIRGGQGSIERSAQTATILLAIPVLVIGLISLIAFSALSILLNRAMKWLPPYGYKAQKIAQQISAGVGHVSRATKQPFMIIESWGNALGRIVSRRG